MFLLLVLMLVMLNFAFLLMFNLVFCHTLLLVVGLALLLMVGLVHCLALLVRAAVVILMVELAGMMELALQIMVILSVMVD